MKNLAGIRIVVTRPAAQASELAEPLREAGAHVEVCPLIRIQPIAAADAVARVVAELDEFAWVVFTSSNGVDQFMHLLTAAQRDALKQGQQQIASVGPVTAAALARYGFEPEVIPAAFVGDAVAQAIRSKGTIEGKRILIARAIGGGLALPAELRAYGALVEDLPLYKSVLDEAGAARLAGLLTEEQVDLITFTAGSAVTYFVQAVGSSRAAAVAAAVAVIGPSTAAAARRHGVRVDVEANPHTTTGLVNAIQDYYAAGRGHWRSNAGN
jgi:uroporphyrinogen III methyltransferase/synthase